MAYENIRDPFDIIEQYARFFELQDNSPSHQFVSTTNREILRTLEEAYQDSLNLINNLKDVYNTALEAGQFTQDECNFKIEELESEQSSLESTYQKSMERMLQKLNPKNLKSGYLVPLVEADRTFDTTVMNTEKLVKAILSIILN